MKSCVLRMSKTVGGWSEKFSVPEIITVPFMDFMHVAPNSSVVISHCAFSLPVPKLTEEWLASLCGNS